MICDIDKDQRLPCKRVIFERVTWQFFINNFGWLGFGLDHTSLIVLMGFHDINNKSCLWFHQSVLLLHQGFKSQIDVHRIWHLLILVHVCHALRTKVPMMLLHFQTYIKGPLLNASRNFFAYALISISISISIIWVMVESLIHHTIGTGELVNQNKTKA